MNITKNTDTKPGTDLGQRIAGWAIVLVIIYLVIAQ